MWRNKLATNGSYGALVSKVPFDYIKTGPRLTRGVSPHCVALQFTLKKYLKAKE